MTMLVEAPALTAAYRRVRELTEELASPLSPEDQVIQSMPEASPAKWHRAHTSWFFETFVLGPHDPFYRPANPAYPYLFNSYYDEVGPRHPRARRGLLSRPSVADVAAYRARIDAAMAELLERESRSEVHALVELGLHHEQQHQELLLMDIKHALSVNPLAPAYREAAVRDPSRVVVRAWVEHGGGLAHLGHEGRDFCFDNEHGRHVVSLEPFALATTLVTNGEWRAFIADDGYRRPDLWLADGWARVHEEGWQAPLYWRATNGSWSVFTLAGERPVVDDEPVCHVSYYEADAFARWAGARLPTEAEWEAVASVSQPRRRPFDPGFVQPLPAGNAPGLQQLHGEVWQWTSSAYLPYPGYRRPAGAVGEYNGKFMVNQMVLRGSSCATPEGHERTTYRNYFPPAARWAFAGIRLARDL